MRPTLLLLTFLLLIIPITQAQRIRSSPKHGVYDNLRKAFAHPKRVRVLDLRGQGLDSVPVAINQFVNLEALLLGHKLRNLWLYPRAWKYKFKLRHLPAGGYAHLQGRGRGEYYLWNQFKQFTVNPCLFPKLRVIDIYYTDIAQEEALKIEQKLTDCNSKALVLRNSIASWDAYSARRDKAKEFLLANFGFKYW